MNLVVKWLLPHQVSYHIAGIFAEPQFIVLPKKFRGLNFRGKQDFTKHKVSWLVCTRNACNRDLVKLCSVVMDALVGGTEYSHKRKWAVLRKTRHRQQQAELRKRVESLESL